MTIIRTIAVLLVVSACAGAPSDSAAPATAPIPATPAGETDAETGPVSMAQAWTYGSMNLRAGPGTRHPVVGQLPAGTQIWIGKPDATGWARVYDPEQFSMEAASSRGWIYSRSRLLGPTPPKQRRRP